jgi:hypothetical protein
MLFEHVSQDFLLYNLVLKKLPGHPQFLVEGFCFLYLILQKISKISEHGEICKEDNAMLSLIHGNSSELHKEEQENETQHVYKIG